MIDQTGSGNTSANQWLEIGKDATYVIEGIIVILASVFVFVARVIGWILGLAVFIFGCWAAVRILRWFWETSMF